MKIFKNPNLSGGWKCPICKESKLGEVVLVGINGTQEDGLMQAEQIHLECIDLLYYPKDKILAQKINRA